MTLTETERQYRELVTDFIETVWNEGDIDALDEFFAPDFAGYGFGVPEVDVEGYREYLKSVFGGLSNLHVEINDTVCEQDTVAVRMTAMGTHDDDLLGIPPTNLDVRIPMMKLCKFTGNRIDTLWLTLDEGNLLRHLGVIGDPVAE